MKNNNYNYLTSLPCKREFAGVKEDYYHMHLINKIITSSDNTEDYTLLNFKHQRILLHNY